ncbi:MAG TPA: hypothetical protein VFL83_16240 [Anaeromyxobacter sp.]|nr:hypothetical protein [Anaeromyxobacter sp.]
MRAALVLTLAFLAGCGALGRGTWDDDPGNWGRAFASAPPPGAVLVHSRYTRSAPFARRFEAYFHLAASADLYRELVRDDAIVRVHARDLRWARTEATPGWFAPKPPHSYDVFALAAPGREFRIFVDRRTRELFVTDRHL